MSQYQYGDRIKFREEKQSYVVQAASDRYLVCTKPFNARKTVLYCIVDLELGLRGPANYVFCPYDLSERRDCLELLEDVKKGRAAISHRRNLPLDIER